MNGLNRTISRKPVPVYHEMFSPHTERLSDTADQSWWWKFKSTCTCTERLQNTYFKFWEMLPLMPCTPAQRRLKKETFWKFVTIFLEKSSIFMLLTIIITLHVEYQKRLISFIATLITPFYLPLPGKNSNFCLITHHCTTQEWGGGETYQATWKNSDSIKILAEC